MSDDIVIPIKKPRKLTGICATGAGGPGRPPGMQNKITIEFRDTVRRLLEKNTQNVGVWLDRVAEDDPGRALELLARLAEFAAPKLARTEVVGDSETPIEMIITWQQSVG